MSGPSAPRKHHLVPRFYLERWARDGMIAVTEINSRRQFTTSPANAGRETDFYRVESEDLDAEQVPPLLFEKMLGNIEGAAVPAFDELIASGADRMPGEARFNMATFVAFQSGRGHRFRASLNSIAHNGHVAMFRSMSPDGMRTYLGADATDDEVADAMQSVADQIGGDMEIRPQQAQSVWMIGEAAQHLMPALMTRRWSVAQTPIDLVTTDDPVVMLGGPGWPRGQRPGVMTAPVILMPLSPRHLLGIHEPFAAAGIFDTDLSAAETEEVNRELLAHAHRWRYSTPHPIQRVPSLPPPVPDSIFEHGIPVVGHPDSELIHSFHPNRWLYAGDVPWPVARWWHHIEPQAGPPSPWMTGHDVQVNR